MEVTQPAASPLLSTTAMGTLCCRYDPYLDVDSVLPSSPYDGRSPPGNEIREFLVELFFLFIEQPVTTAFEPDQLRTLDSEYRKEQRTTVPVRNSLLPRQDPLCTVTCGGGNMNPFRRRWP